MFGINKLKKRIEWLEWCSDNPILYEMKDVVYYKVMNHYTSVIILSSYQRNLVYYNDKVNIYLVDDGLDTFEVKESYLTKELPVIINNFKSINNKSKICKKK